MIGEEHEGMVDVDSRSSFSFDIFPIAMVSFKQYDSIN